MSFKECGIKTFGDEKNYIGSSCETSACPLRGRASGFFSAKPIINETIRFNPEITPEVAEKRMETIIQNIKSMCEMEGNIK